MTCIYKTELHFMIKPSEYLTMFSTTDITHLKIAESNNNYGTNTVGCDPLFDLDSKQTLNLHI